MSKGDVIGGPTLSSTRWPYLNDGGDVVFESGFGVFSLTNFLVSAGLNPAINDAGNLVYNRSVSGFPLESLVDGTLVTSGDVIDGHTVDEAGFPALNDSGEVVFRGFFSGTFGIFSLNELLVAPGDVVGGTTVTSVDTPAINDAGDVAFRGGFSGGVGAFLLPGRLPPNEDPVADAGADQEVECTSPSGTVVTLDGTLSSDPDGDALSYEWSVAAGSGASIDDAGAATTTGTFPIGPTMVTLTVTDGNGGVAVDDVVITVVDTTPPVIVCTTDAAALWPAHHQMVSVALSLVVSDQCENPENLLLQCTASSNEPDDATGDGSSVGDVDGADGFTAAVPITLTYNTVMQSYDGQLLLRAERDGTESSRVYSIVCDVMDSAGNMATSSCVVVVPHDRRKN